MSKPHRVSPPPAGSRLEAYARSVIEEPGRPGIVPGALRGLLGGLASLYEIGLECYLLAERIGLRRRTSLPVPVVSIGNLTVGGTGKTPMTQWLCRRLGEEGRRVAVLSRGHGGTGTAVRIVSSGKGVPSDAGAAGAADAGDEPALLARTLPGVPVLTGKDRRLSGREALRRFPLDALVLDDGLQYWQLWRDLDIVLLDARRPFDNGRPLPRGLLREPKSHLRRAQAVVITRSGGLADAAREALKRQVAALASEADVYFADHRPVGLSLVTDLSAPPVGLDRLAGLRVVALCGIAQPTSFLESLERCGALVARELTYADHARYTEVDVRRAARALEETGADALVMTEKDAVKWPGGLDAPCYAVRIEMQVEDGDRLMETVVRRLFGRGALAPNPGDTGTGRRGA
jgi:tetraacyldisaccharide 4'-kinase